MRTPLGFASRAVRCSRHRKFLSEATTDAAAAKVLVDDSPPILPKSLQLVSDFEAIHNKYRRIFETATVEFEATQADIAAIHCFMANPSASITTGFTLLTSVIPSSKPSQASPFQLAQPSQNAGAFGDFGQSQAVEFEEATQTDIAGIDCFMVNSSPYIKSHFTLLTSVIPSCKPSNSSPFQLAQRSQNVGDFGNFGQTQAAGLGGFGAPGNFGQSNYRQSSVAQDTEIVQQAPVLNRFGTLPPMPLMSVGRAGTSPSMQYAISSLPIVQGFSFFKPRSLQGIFWNGLFWRIQDLTISTRSLLFPRSASGVSVVPPPFARLWQPLRVKVPADGYLTRERRLEVCPGERMLNGKGVLPGLVVNNHVVTIRRLAKSTEPDFKNAWALAQQPSQSSPFQLAQPSQNAGAFGNFGQTQAAGLSGFGTPGNFGQSNYRQLSVAHDTAVVQQAPVLNSFGTLPAMPLMSVGRAGTSPSMQYAISSLPVLSLSRDFLTRPFSLRHFSTTSSDTDDILRDFSTTSSDRDKMLRKYKGLDFMHWIVVMDMPKASEMTTQDMIDVYLTTAAKIVGSVEEAKNRIYACGTTTYQGFQIQGPEIMAKKFEGLPEVVCVAPDKFCNLTNKEYGGDVYVNGSPKSVPFVIYDEWIVVFKFSEVLSDEEMKNKFVQITAETLGSTCEEASKKMSEIETKKYWGFHIKVPEVDAKKFVGKPEVFQVLPASGKPQMVAFQILKR